MTKHDDDSFANQHPQRFQIYVTKDEFLEAMSFLDSLGYTWYSGNSLLDKDHSGFVNIGTYLQVNVFREERKNSVTISGGKYPLDEGSEYDFDGDYGGFCDHIAAMSSVYGVNVVIDEELL